MKCGVWLEMESCAKNSTAFSMLNDCLLRRNGIIIGGNRAFFDFREERVREYTIDAIDKLYASGVRFIKNDYNHNICIGCDGADSLSEGLAEHRKAFLDFIDSVKQKYPDLIIESCSSGAMRMDYGLVKHMDLQSVSDQEIYYNNPAIAAGALSVMPPEKCGFWAYPYPLLYENQPKEYEYDILNISCDKEETIFNMINSMLGIIYLSGHIELCDNEDAQLIKEGIALYKTYRKYIPQSEVIYLTEPLSIGESGVMSIGLKTEIGTIAAVWKINSDADTVEISIPKKLGKSVELIYPAKLETKYCVQDGVLKIEAPDKYMARLFMIKDNGGI
jgi:alpha-galactosidase